MSDITIGRLALTLHGVSTEIAVSALQGLEGELARRLSVRGIDATALRDLSPTIRLPAITATAPLSAEDLRAHIADGLVSLLISPASSTPSGRD